MSPEAASTASDSKTEKLVQRLSGLVDEYSKQHQTKSALFWSGQLVSFSKERPECVIRHAEALYADGQYQRAAYTITSRGLDKSDLRGCYIAAREGYNKFFNFENYVAHDIFDSKLHDSQQLSDVPGQSLTPRIWRKPYRYLMGQLRSLRKLRKSLRRAGNAKRCGA